MNEPPQIPDRITEAARRASERESRAAQDPEPSLGRRFAQIGVLGWIIVGPILLGVVVGSWLDRMLGSGITLAAALTVAGAALGLWLALRWMHGQ
jgi:ATP synthase protein I